MNNSVSINSKRMRVIIPFLIAITTFHMFRVWPILERSWLIEGVAFVFVVFSIKGFTKTKTFYYIIIYCVVLLINVFLGDDFFNSFSIVIMELFCYSIPAAFTYYFLRNYDHVGMKNTVRVFYLLFVYIVFVSFMLDIQYPGIIREYVGYLYGNYDTSRFTPFFRMGMSNYYMPHAAPILIPAVYLGVTNKRFNKWTRFLLAVVWVSIILLTYLSGAATALLFSLLFSIPVFFIKRTHFSKNTITLLVVFAMVVPIILNTDRLLSFLSYSGSVLSDTQFSSKIEDMEDVLNYGEASGDIDGRNIRYTKSLNRFISNPIIGTNESVGEHSALLDRAACLGLIGLLPYLLLLFSQFKFVIRFMNYKYRTFYYYGIMISLIMLLLKFMSNYEMFMITFTILPISIIMLGGDDVIEVYNSNNQ